MMVPVEYLAGLIDGEGYVAVGRIPRRGRTHEYPVRVVVYNSNRELLEEMQFRWGGTLSNSGQRKPNWKPGYALIWTNAAAAELLAQVAPFLRVKSKLARALLEYHQRVGMCRRIRDSRGRLLPLSQGEVEFREAFHKHIKGLNARGLPLMTAKPAEEMTARESSSSENTLSLDYLGGSWMQRVL